MAVICIFKQRKEKYFVLRMNGDNLKKINNFVFENDSHELNEFLPEDILQNEWIKTYPIISIELINYSEKESDKDEVTIKLMKKHGINNVRGGSYSNLELGNDTIDQLQNLLI